MNRAGDKRMAARGLMRPGKEIELENSRLRKAVSDLTLDKLILQEAARGNF
jgi:putative transposase